MFWNKIEQHISKKKKQKMKKIHNKRMVFLLGKRRDLQIVSLTFSFERFETDGTDINVSLS